ncbi:Serine/threonine protein kinase PrkC, regulator of stationary phase [Olavius algarvensis Delta 1 endosymbiont]|nr:Serine/threonine protein kinase PrkC, regulator of stationary phase [Olavius algarvensis Delta 1 endosymbiont]
MCIFSQYRLNSGNIEKKFSHIGILRKNSQFFGFNLLLNLIYVIAIIEHSNL